MLQLTRPVLRSLTIPRSGRIFSAAPRPRPGQGVDFGPSVWVPALGIFLRGVHSRTFRKGLGSSSEEEAQYNLEGGNDIEALADGTGGWLAHRAEASTPGSGPGTDWINEVFSDPSDEQGADLSATAAFKVPSARLTHPPRILVLYGSLRPSSFSRKLAHECARLLEVLGAEVRTFCPRGLPVRDPALEDHPKVQELRNLSRWSEGHVWVSPEMHGCVTGAFKNQIDWLPLNTGSVRPTQAWQEFDEDGRMKDSNFRDRVVDVMEEYYKFTLIMREHADALVDRFSERKEVAQKGRLLTQAEHLDRTLQPFSLRRQKSSAFGHQPIFQGMAGTSSEEEARYTLEGANDIEPLADGTGSWLAHRAKKDVPGSGPGDDWITEVFSDPSGAQGANIASSAAFQVPSARFAHRPRILVLYGSLRPTSFSRKMAHECARLLEVLGAEVRTFNPMGLPVRDPALEDHPKVQELRNLSKWSEGHVWSSPEMHGCITGAFKNQIDWLPLNTGSVRPTQGRTCVVLQVNGGSQSFNAVNELRRLARWMRMPCCTNQSSVPKAWQEFDDDGRMKDSSFRDRVVDVMEEFYKFTLIMREHTDALNDRFSERKEVAQKGRLLTQAEKEKLKNEASADAGSPAVGSKK
ncbi:arsH [Symbiodinium necroappetens]|uniref:ArsH protein n=1 Tax=Symbiodinium necroappetens TaxID=1628268 RepID=A0A813AFS3_9DINO|nr:arsH [Symbiodinium necroappetens]